MTFLAGNSSSLPHGSPSSPRNRLLEPTAVLVALLMALLAAAFALGVGPRAVVWVCEGLSSLFDALLDCALSLQSARWAHGA